jgi:methionyl-tRNA formyltransferase
MLTKDDFALDWSQGALAIHRRVMGLYPGSHTHWQGQRLKVLATEPLVKRLADQLSPEAATLAGHWGMEPGDPPPGTPGEVLAIEPSTGLVVATGGCPVLLREGQLEGRRAASGAQLIQQLGASRGALLNASQCSR